MTGRPKRERKAEFACMECGRKFRTTAAAERAAMCGCPKCGGCDIDLNTEAEGAER